MTEYFGLDANDCYQKVLTHLTSGGASASAPRGMKIREVLNAGVTLNDPLRCVVSIPERKLNYHFMVAEWWWIATGRNDVASITPYCKDIAKYSDDGITFFGNYGTPWRKQVEYVVKKLREDSDSRQAVITLWRESPGQTKDVPCTVSMQYLLRDKRLKAIVTMRSWDAWLGMPYDLHNFSRLQAMVAGAVGAELGSLHINAGSLHLYDRNLEAAGMLPRNTGSSPPLPHLPGLIPEEVAHISMAERPQLLGQYMDQRWYEALCVLEHRWEPEVALGSPWRELIR